MVSNEHLTLISSEIGPLWNTYMLESMAECTFSYFLETVEDDDIKSILTQSLNNTKTRLKKTKDIFMKDNIPIPQGFTEEDVNLEAPRLYSDSYYSYYVWFINALNLGAYILYKSTSARSDVSQLFDECLFSTSALETRIRELILEKGYFIKSPYIPMPEKVDFVKKQSFLTGWFGERRPLLAMEISALFRNVLTNAIGHSLIMGFS